jgi:hypothetical protein
MMFDFWSFYKGLFKRTNYFDNYLDKFPEGNSRKFKKETLLLLEKNVKERDSLALSNTLTVIFKDGADEDFTDLLLLLLDEDWHTSEEDIVELLEIIKDPKATNKLYEVAINVPDYDEMRALAKKCMWALSSINTNESIEKLKKLAKSDDSLIAENALFHLEKVIKEN